jgi:hypothetical protein
VETARPAPSQHKKAQSLPTSAPFFTASSVTEMYFNTERFKTLSDILPVFIIGSSSFPPIFHPD